MWLEDANILNKRDRLVAVSWLQPHLNNSWVVFLFKPKEGNTMPIKKPATQTDTKIPETLIEAMYKFIENNPKYVMPIHDIYALYDIATMQFSRTIENFVKELKKQNKSKK